MNEIFCDVCGRVLGRQETRESGLYRPPDGSTMVTPGYVGAKLLCPACWIQWGYVVKQFFGKRGL